MDKRVHQVIQLRGLHALDFQEVILERGHVTSENEAFNKRGYANTKGRLHNTTV